MIISYVISIMPKKIIHRDPCKQLSKKYVSCLTGSYLSSIDVKFTTYCNNDKKMFEQCLKSKHLLKNKKSKKNKM